MSKCLSQPVGSWPRSRNCCFAICHTQTSTTNARSLTPFASLQTHINYKRRSILSILDEVQRARSSTDKGTGPRTVGVAPMGVYRYTVYHHILHRRQLPHLARRRPARQAKTQTRTTSVRGTLRSTYPVCLRRRQGAHSRAAGERPQSCPTAAFTWPCSRRTRHRREGDIKPC